jgi:flagellar assembly factor FliW
MLLVHTPVGLPGFDSARDWVLEGDDTKVFSLLRNLDEPSIGLLVAPPWDMAPGYEPDLPDEELVQMGIEDAGDVNLFVVATIVESSPRPAVPEPDTAPESAPETAPERSVTVLLNLAAPIVLNRHSGVARQLILDRQGWPLRHPVVAKG